MTCSPACGYKLRSQKVSGAAEAKDTLSESQSRTGNEWSISIPRTRISSLEELVEHCKVDLKVWTIDRFVCNKWEVGAKDKDSKIQVTPLFQVKAWFKKKVNVDAAIQELNSLKEDAKKLNLLKFPALKKSTAPSGNFLELSIPDLHLGKLAWSKETGHSDYDRNIAESLFRESISKLVDRTAFYRPELMTLVVGNDLLNADNRENTTTKGTPQTSTDSRYQKTFRQARLMISEAIVNLRRIAPVRVVMVPGNHDTLSVWHLGESLECLFHNDKDIHIDNSPTLRKYFRWGKVGLMWTHGDKVKHEKMPLLMAAEDRKMWGQTVWNEIHVGHLHQVGLREINGIRVRILPSLCAPDAWHSEMGYVGNIRSAEAYVWNKEEGLIATATFAIASESSPLSRAA